MIEEQASKEYFEDMKWAGKRYPDFQKQYSNMWLAIVDKKVITFGKSRKNVEIEAVNKTNRPKKGIPIIFIKESSKLQPQRDNKSQKDLKTMVIYLSELVLGVVVISVLAFLYYAEPIICCFGVGLSIIIGVGGAITIAILTISKKKDEGVIPKTPQEFKKEGMDDITLYDGIRKLGELRDDGLITEEEFQIKKKELLGIEKLEKIDRPKPSGKENIEEEQESNIPLLRPLSKTPGSIKEEKTEKARLKLPCRIVIKTENEIKAGVKCPRCRKKIRISRSQGEGLRLKRSISLKCPMCGDIIKFEMAEEEKNEAKEDLKNS